MLRFDMAAAATWTGGDLRKSWEETYRFNYLWAVADTLKYLEKGGRITPAQQRWNTSPFKTGSDDTGREAGRICEGADDETGAFHDDHGDHPRSGKSV